MVDLAIIGAGQRASHIMRLIRQLDGDARLAVVADPEPNHARHWLKKSEVPIDSTTFVPDVQALLNVSDRLDGLIIGTRCDSHASLAVLVAEMGLPLFLEKPVGVTREDLIALSKAYAGKENSIVISFPLRMSPMFQRALQIIRIGRVGTINQVVAYNYVSYGGVYFSQWYRDHTITGGMWLQKATHDFDYINKLIGQDPIAVTAMETRAVYGGDKPDDLVCSRCEEAGLCPESPINIAQRGDDGGMGTDDHPCVFSRSIQNHDAGSAIVMYQGGVHAAYSQNLVTRRTAHGRGARVTGYKATLEFDWYTQTIRVIEHHGKAVQEIKVEADEVHHGGDTTLARNFLDVIRGEDLSCATLMDGIRSAAMCLAAKEAALTRTCQPIAITDIAQDARSEAIKP